MSRERARRGSAVRNSRKEEGKKNGRVIVAAGKYDREKGLLGRAKGRFEVCGPALLSTCFSNNGLLPK